MRIGFCGIGASGKTTQAKMLAEELGLEFRPSQTRAINAACGLAEKDYAALSHEAFWALQQEVLASALRTEEIPGDYITDRILLDYIAYTLIACSFAVSQKAYYALLMQAGVSLSNYNYCFWLEPLPEQCWYDGYRLANPATRRALGAVLENLMPDTPKIHKIPYADSGTRHAQILAILGRAQCHTSL